MKTLRHSALACLALVSAGSARAQGGPLPPPVLVASPASEPASTPATPLVLAPPPSASTSATAVTTTTTVTTAVPAPVPLATLVLKTRLPMREAPRVGVAFVMLMPGTTLYVYGTPMAPTGTTVPWMKVGTDAEHQGWASATEVRAQY